MSYGRWVVGKKVTGMGRKILRGLEGPLGGRTWFVRTLSSALRYSYGGQAQETCRDYSKIIAERYCLSNNYHKVFGCREMARCLFELAAPKTDWERVDRLVRRAARLRRRPLQERGRLVVCVVRRAARLHDLARINPSCLRVNGRRTLRGAFSAGRDGTTSRARRRGRSRGMCS